MFQPFQNILNLFLPTFHYLILKVTFVLFYFVDEKYCSFMLCYNFYMLDILHVCDTNVEIWEHVKYGSRRHDTTIDRRPAFTRLQKQLLIFLQRNIGDVRYVRYKRHIGPSSAEALRQYWFQRNGNGTGNRQLRNRRSVIADSRKQSERWNYDKLIKLLQKYYKSNGNGKYGYFQTSIR